MLNCEKVDCSQWKIEYFCDSFGRIEMMTKRKYSFINEMKYASTGIVVLIINKSMQVQLDNSRIIKVLFLYF